MKKKFIAIVGAAVLCFSMTSSAVAAAYAAPQGAYGYGFCGGGYSLMRDQNGNILSQSAFEENLDSLINSGALRPEDRDFFLQRYEWCSTYSGVTTGFRGGCGGRGMGRGMYR